MSNILGGMTVMRWHGSVLAKLCRHVFGAEVSRDGGQGGWRGRGSKRHQPSPGAAVERVHDGHAILIFVACGRQVKTPPKRKKPRWAGLIRNLSVGRLRARRGYPRKMTTG